MNRRQIATTVAAAAVVLGTGSGIAVAAGGRADADSGAGSPAACRPGSGTPQEIANAKLIIEYNAKDEDFGVHGAFGDAGWAELCVRDPNGVPVLVVDPVNTLGDLGLGDIFFESREPPVADYPFEQLAIDFPEGDYTVRGTGSDGQELFGVADFTHDVPAAPVIRSPRLAAEPELIRGPVRRNLTVAWEAVAETLDGNAVDITGYQVIVTKEVPNDPNGFSRPTYDVHVPASLNSLSVPQEFFEPNTTYELEVLALEVSGNQTISLGFFRTR